MTREDIQNLLKAYRGNKARLVHLGLRLAELKKLENELMEHAGYYFTSTTPVYSAVPGGGKVESKVEKLALTLADGRKPAEMQDITQEEAEIDAEVTERTTQIKYVDAWMMALSPRQRMVITCHYLNGMPWRDVISAYEEEYGITLGYTGVKYIARAAMRKIYEAGK